jgi:hypothetical protein
MRYEDSISNTMDNQFRLSNTLDLVYWNGGNPRSVGSDNILEDGPQISQGLIKKRKKLF